MSDFYLKKWGRKPLVYRWENKSVFKRVDREPKAINGFFKDFLFVGKMIVYQENESWFVNLSGIDAKVSEINSIDIKSYGPLTKSTIHLNNKKFSCCEISFFDFFARKFDPTYDAIDSELVFSNWFFSRYQKETGNLIGDKL